MNFESYYWPDSQLIRIQIEYDHASIIVWNELLQQNLVIECCGLAGMTNLCIWDDTIIMDARLHSVCDNGNEFVCNLYAAYDKNYNYGGRRLIDGLLELRIELANLISFSVYCQNVHVVECDE